MSKLCPKCGEVIGRRVSKGNDKVCPKCETPIVLFNGEYYNKMYVAPVEKLTRTLEKAVRDSQSNIFPYRIPQHMLIRTKKVLDKCWRECFPVMYEIGISQEDAIELFQLAFEELLGEVSEPDRDLGLVLWYISGKETNKFQRILTKFTKIKERLMSTSVTDVDNWLTGS